MNLPTDAGWQWIGGVCAVVATFLLKHLHGRIEQAVGKAELAEALKRLADQRVEDMQRYEQYRRERLSTEVEIFERLGSQDKILARIDERTERWVPRAGGVH